MKMVHIRLSITTYSYASPTIFYHENLNGKTYTTTTLGYYEACRRMWELKKLGGEKVVESHPYAPAIATREIDFWDFS